jgi:hypothetical protein
LLVRWLAILVQPGVGGSLGRGTCAPAGLHDYVLTCCEPPVPLVAPASLQGEREFWNFVQSNLKLLILAATVIFNYSLDVNRLHQFEEIAGSHESAFRLFSTLTFSHAELDQVTKTKVAGIIFYLPNGFDLTRFQ